MCVGISSDVINRINFLFPPVTAQKKDRKDKNAAKNNSSHKATEIKSLNNSASNMKPQRLFASKLLISGLLSFDFKTPLIATIKVSAPISRIGSIVEVSMVIVI